MNERCFTLNFATQLHRNYSAFECCRVTNKRQQRNRNKSRDSHAQHSPGEFRNVPLDGEFFHDARVPPTISAVHEALERFGVRYKRDIAAVNADTSLKFRWLACGGITIFGNIDRILPDCCWTKNNVRCRR